tara:strand:+ start:58 stop:1428 length:1371 start_codon:yes stop_codon:yes gene_type:complete
MGLFSKIWKGVKKGVKSIGKGIKSAFKKFGKFMNKIGVLGQIAMMFILPGIGQALGSMWTGIAGQTAAQGAAAAASASASAVAGATAAGATASAAAAAGATAAASVVTTAGGLAGYTGALSGVANAAGNMMRFVSSTVGKAGTVFNNITSGISETLTNFSQTAGKKLGFQGDMFANAADNFFGPGNSASSRSFGEASRLGNLTESKSFFTARDTQYEKAFKDAADEASKAITKSTPDITTETSTGSKTGSFKKVSAETPAITGDSLTSGQIQAAGEEIKTSALYDEGFVQAAQAEKGMIGHKFGERELFIDPVRLSDTYGGEFYKNYATGEVRSNAVVEGFQSMGQSLLDMPKNMYNEAKGFVTNPLKGASGQLQSKAITRLAQETGLEQEPVYNQYSYAANIPQFQVASVGTYGAPELMNARSFEQQVTNNPMPYGYTAFQYDGYMKQSNQYGTA